MKLLLDTHTFIWWDSLPPIHKDPFDRLLIAQANVENAVLVSCDPIISQYPVNIAW